MTAADLPTKQTRQSSYATARQKQRPPSAAARKRSARTFVEPHRIVLMHGAVENIIEISAHQVSRQIAMFMPHVFPDCQEHNNNLCCICTFQKAQIDIIERNEATEAERSRLYKNFSTLAEKIKQRIIVGQVKTSNGKDKNSNTKSDRPIFVDYADMDGTPCSTTIGGSAFNEVEVARAVLGYKLSTVGGVSIIVHPQWGRSVYVGSIIVSCTQEDIAVLLSKMSVQL